MKLILACDINGGIGYKNKLPWDHIEGDLPRFKQLTNNKTVVMGRNTYESLPKKPLPNRVNIVISSREISGVTTLSKLPDNYKKNFQDIWLIGGAMLVATSWHLIHEVHLTKTFTAYTCDKFIDLSILQNEFSIVTEEKFTDHNYIVYKRK